MRSYALLVLALAVLHARAASIPAPVQAEKKVPCPHEALDDVSLDNNASEQELVQQPDTVKDVENNLRNSIPENVPVKIIEEQPVIKTIKDDSNDYVPDNDDSLSIKRVEIDLKNPGPPQRQEHDSQSPGLIPVDQEKAIKQSIAESSKVFYKGIQDVTQQFKTFFDSNKNEDLNVVQEKIQYLKSSVNAEVKKLSETINSCLKVPVDETKGGAEQLEKISEIKEVEKRFNILESTFNNGVNMLSEGVELLSILKEEDEKEAEKPFKISGKADNETPAQGSGPQPENTGSSSTTGGPSVANPVLEFVQNFQTQMSNTFNSFTSSVTNIFNPGQNENSSGSSTSSPFNPANLFQNFNFPNFFLNQNQNQGQPQGQSPPAGAQSDDVSTSTTAGPNVFQQISNAFQNVISPGNNQQQQQQTQPQNPNGFIQMLQNRPIVSLVSTLVQGVTGQQNQQTSQPSNTAVNQPAAEKPVAAAPATVPGPVAPETQGTNEVPAPAPQADPPKPGKETQPVENQGGPIQQMVQNNPIVQGITHAVQRIQGLSNPSKPRDTPVPENPDPKGHHPGNAGNNNDSDGIVKNEPVKAEPESTPEIKNEKPEPVAELNKTE